MCPLVATINTHKAVAQCATLHVVNDQFQFRFLFINGNFRQTEFYIITVKQHSRVILCRNLCFKATDVTKLIVHRDVYDVSATIFFVHKIITLDIRSQQLQPF